MASAVRVTPRRSTATIATTAAAATARAWSGQAWEPRVRAIAAHDAVLPVTNAHPARNPHVSPSRRRPYT